MSHTVKAHKPKPTKRGRPHRFSGEVHDDGSVTTTINHHAAEQAAMGSYQPMPPALTSAHPHVRAALKHIKNQFAPAGEPDGDEGGM